MPRGAALPLAGKHLLNSDVSTYIRQKMHQPQTIQPLSVRLERALPPLAAIVATSFGILLRPHKKALDLLPDALKVGHDRFRGGLVTLSGSPGRVTH